MSKHRRESKAARRLPTLEGRLELVLKLFASAMGVRCGREEGQTVAEYGVILAVVTLAVVASLVVLSGGISTTFENLAGILPG